MENGGYRIRSANPEMFKKTVVVYLTGVGGKLPTEVAPVWASFVFKGVFPEKIVGRKLDKRSVWV